MPLRSGHRRVAAVAVAVWAQSLAVLQGYEEPSHFSFTLYLARLAGYPNEVAFRIAAEDQGVDDNRDSSPMPHWLDGPGVDRREMYHFVSAERIRTLEKEGEQCRPPSELPLFFRRLGILLHASEDLSSHRGFTARFGHALAGHAPDKPWHAPGEFIDMGRRKFDRLRNLRAKCGPGSKTAAPKTDFDESLTILQAWSDAEVMIGTKIAADSEAQPRWTAMTKRLYGTGYSFYTERAVREYAKWKDERVASDWRVE